VTSEDHPTVIFLALLAICVTFIPYPKISEASDAVSLDFLLFRADATRHGEEKSYRAQVACSGRRLKGVMTIV
jgi:hypothetical protein